MKSFILCGVLLLASSASASCLRTSCICLSESSAPSPAGTLEATITSIDGARTTFNVVTVRGSVMGVVEGGTVTLPRQLKDAVNQRWLMFYAGDAFHTRLIIEQGLITCGGTLPVQDASDLFARADCFDATEARGFTPPCNDTGNGCSTTGLPLGALLFLGMRRARRVR